MELLAEAVTVLRGSTARLELARDELVAAGGRPRRDAIRGRDSLTPASCASPS